MRYLLIYMLVFPICLLGQDYVSYKVGPGEKPDVALPVLARYCYETFIPGTVHFRSGTISRATLNYSHLHRQMQFIRAGDTLSLTNETDIKFVVVGTDSFYFVQKYWLKQLAAQGPVKLAEHKLLDYANNEKMGAYNGKSLGSVERVQSIDNVGLIDKSYVAREELIFVERNFYYFSDRFGNFVQASRKNLIDLFGKSHPDLPKYLSDTKPNYYRRQDMLAIMDLLGNQ